MWRNKNKVALCESQGSPISSQSCVFGNYIDPPFPFSSSIIIRATCEKQIECKSVELLRPFLREGEKVQSFNLQGHHA